MTPATSKSASRSVKIATDQGRSKMVAAFRSRAGFTVSNKSEEQMAKEDIRNRQACSMRFRREVKVSIKQAPWEGTKDEQTTSRKSR